MAWQRIGFATGLSGSSRLALGLGPYGLEWHGLGCGYGTVGLAKYDCRGGCHGGAPWGWCRYTDRRVELCVMVLILERWNFHLLRFSNFSSLYSSFTFIRRIFKKKNSRNKNIRKIYK